jgi:hypothetical protein
VDYGSSHISKRFLRHHINVMHQERNVAESIVMMCINFTDKTKYNIKMRKDLGATCDRPSLELNDKGHKPHAPFYLKPKQKREVMQWLKNLKFLDGFAVGFRRAPNLKTGKLTRLKSHDCHIIME